MPKNLHKWLIFSIFVVSNYNIHIRPLEQVKDLCITALRSQKLSNAAFVSFFVDAMLGVLTIQGRINFLQLARFCKSCEQRFRQNFRKSFDWIAFNQSFMKKHPDHRYAIAIDPSFVSKSGKKTPGIGYFWSGCAQSVKRGLEILGIALVDANTREAFAVRAVQTLTDIIHRGRRPKCLAQIERDSLVAHYLRAIYTYQKQLLQFSNIIVADAFFSKATFVNGIAALGFNIVSRFRDDVRLRYRYNGERTGKRGRPKQFDGTVELNNLREDIFTTELLDWDGHTIKAHSATVYAVSLERDVKAVIVEFEDKDKKTQTRKVFFSTDCTLSAKEIIDIYRSRFQIEFLFRDAKQFMGLCHCQARDKKALDFAFNLSLAAINVAKAFAKQNNINLSTAKLKLLFHNALMIDRFLSTFGNTPDINKNTRQKEHYFKELMLYGLYEAG